MSDHKLEIVLSARDITGKVFKNLQTEIQGITKNVFSLKGALAGLAGGYGLAQIAKGALNVAAAFEKFETQLTTIMGSSVKAKESMTWIEDFTRKTPYELDQVVGGFVKLQAYGLDATKWMGTLGDTASSMGKSLNDSVEMFADAIQGEFERLKEFGVRAEQSGNKVTFKWVENGKQMVLSAEKTQSGISEALGKVFSRFEGGMDKQAKTWNGLMSNMADSWTMFQKKVMEAGIFDELKTQLASVNEGFSEWVKNNEALIKQKVPEYLERIKAGIADIWSTAKHFDSEVIKVGLVGWILFGPLGGVAAGYTSLKLKEINDELERTGKIAKRGGEKTLLEHLGLSDREANIKKRIREQTAYYDQAMKNAEGWRGDVLGKDTYLAEAERAKKEISVLMKELSSIVDKSATGIQSDFTGINKEVDIFSTATAKATKEVEKLVKARAGLSKPPNAGPGDQYISWLFNDLDAEQIRQQMEAKKVDYKPSYAKDTSGAQYIDWLFNDQDAEHVKQQMEGIKTDWSLTMRDMLERSNDWRDGIKLGMMNVKEYARTTAQDMAILWEEAAYSMGDTSGNFLYDAFTGKLKSLGDYIRSFVDDMLREFTRLAGHSFAKSMFGEGGFLPGLFKGFSTGGTSSSLPAEGIGLRASGGPVSAGQTYIVGENGPELLRMGGPGYVVPNHAMGQGGNSVQIEIHNYSPEKAEVQHERGAGGVDVMRIIIGKAVDSIRSGGPMDQAIRQTYGLQRVGVTR